MNILDLHAMENKLYIGIDNGVSGTIGAIYNNQTWFEKVPVRSEQNYTKKKANVTRIDFPKLLNFLATLLDQDGIESIICLIERPMVNSTRFKASTSALRALESTLIAVEYFHIPIQYEDSKAWQRELLPRNIKGSPELKEASKQIGCRLFPQHEELIVKHGDADGMLLAEYARRKF